MFVYATHIAQLSDKLPHFTALKGTGKFVPVLHYALFKGCTGDWKYHPFFFYCII